MNLSKNHNSSFDTAIFSTFPFLEKLSGQEKNSFLTQAQTIKLAKNQSVYFEGDCCQFLPLIISGNIRIYKLGEEGREITLYHLEKGDSCVLTASSIMSQKDFPAFAITLTRVEAVTIPASSLRKWIRHNPIWQDYICGLLSRRLTNVIEIVEEVAFRRMDCRIASYLLKTSGNKSEAISKTHLEIARELGTSREVVSRILKIFEKEELLSLSRKAIALNNRIKLETIARFGIP